LGRFLAATVSLHKTKRIKGNKNVYNILGTGAREVAQATVKVNGSPARLDSLREGVVRGLNKTSPETNSSL